MSALYYKPQLIVYNFTIYDVNRNKGYEGEGKLSTIIVTAMKKKLKSRPRFDFVGRWL